MSEEEFKNTIDRIKKENNLNDADFKTALGRIHAWTTADSGWLPPDSTGERHPVADFKYRNAPIPFRDFPFGGAWRLGFGTTSSTTATPNTRSSPGSATGR